MKFWNALPFMEPADAIDLAVVSDEAGFDGVCVPDHLFYPRELKSAYPYSEDGTPGFGPDAPWPDPWVLIGAMAARTKRIRFTTNIYIAPARDLFTVAKLVSTAAVLSNNRVALGVGAGYKVEAAEGIVRRIKQSIEPDRPFEMILALWANIDADLVRRFADLGVTGLLCAPWMFAGTEELSPRLDAVRRFADDVIARV